MQEAWLEYDVAQCGYCQPGQIMAAVAKVKKARAEGHEITDADLDEIRNVCRCGTYSRIREAIKAGPPGVRHVSRGRAATRATGGTLVRPAPESQQRHPPDGGVRTPIGGTYTRARGQQPGSPSRRRPPDA